MTRKQRRLTMIGGSLVVLACAAALVLYAMSDSIVFFSTPSMVAERHVAAGRRNRLPAATCLSATIEGVEKNTIESLIAYSTSAAAQASTTSEPPIIVKRRCLRVMCNL